MICVIVKPADVAGTTAGSARYAAFMAGVITCAAGILNEKVVVNISKLRLIAFVYAARAVILSPLRKAASATMNCISEAVIIGQGPLFPYTYRALSSVPVVEFCVGCLHKFFG